VSLARVERKIGKIIILMCVLTGSVLWLSWVMMPRLNVLGIGIAWLVSQTGAMIAILPSFIRKLRKT
jgi:hypothetical protein